MNTELVNELKADIAALQAKLQSILDKNNEEVLPEHDFDIALHLYADHLVADYNKIESGNMHVDFEKGRKFLKVVTRSFGSRSAHSFICVKAHNNFEYGDILKAASWNAPAKNFARGNVFKPASYKNFSWAGLVTHRMEVNNI